jgi:hypothetical protein
MRAKLLWQTVLDQILMLLLETWYWNSDFNSLEGGYYLILRTLVQIEQRNVYKAFNSVPV